MLHRFIQKAHKRRRLVHPRIVMGIPSEITDVEKRAVLDAAYWAKASEVHLVDQAMVAAIGAGLPVTEATGNMVVVIGGGTTDIAVVSLAGTVYSRSVHVAGNLMDEKIIEHLKDRHSLVIGERTAEAIKNGFGVGPTRSKDGMHYKGYRKRYQLTTRRSGRLYRDVFQRSFRRFASH